MVFPIPLPFVKTPGCALMLALALAGSAQAAGEVQVGASGRTYASKAPNCALHPVVGMAPGVQAGLYNPVARQRGGVYLDGSRTAVVRTASPDTTVWLPPQVATVSVALSRSVVDHYAFDATPTFAGQPNVCIPDTRANTMAGELEYAASGKSYAVVVPGCANNPQSGRAQPYVNLFDNGSFLLNVSVNGQPLTQLSALRPRVAVFLAAGLNVITAVNGTLSTDAYVRDAGSGVCTLP